METHISFSSPTGLERWISFIEALFTHTKGDVQQKSGSGKLKLRRYKNEEQKLGKKVLYFLFWEIQI